MTIFHIEISNFQAVVASSVDGSLNEKPLLICSQDNKGVVVSCNFLATHYGIVKGQKLSEAKKLCPHIVIKKSNLQLIKDTHCKIKNILFKYSDKIEELSKGGFLIDVERGKEVYYSPLWLADKLQRDIYEQVKLRAGIGIARNRMLAHIAFNWTGMYGIFIVTPEMENDIMRELPISKIPSLGKAMQHKFNKIGIITCGDLQKTSENTLISMCGVTYGRKLYNYAYGRDYRKMKTPDKKKYVSVTHKFTHGLQVFDECDYYLRELFKSLSFKLETIEQGICSQFITVKYQDGKRKRSELRADKCNLKKLQAIMKVLHDYGAGRQIISIGVGVKLSDKKKEKTFQLAFSFR